MIVKTIIETVHINKIHGIKLYSLPSFTLHAWETCYIKGSYLPFSWHVSIFPTGLCIKTENKSTFCTVLAQIVLLCTETHYRAFLMEVTEKERGGAEDILWLPLAELLIIS